MRNHSKKMLSFLLAILLLLGTLPMAINTFAADNKPTLVLNGGNFVNSSTQVSAGGFLPKYYELQKEGFTFGGWYTDPNYSGAQAFVAAANTTYYARWVIHDVNATDFEDVTSSNFSTKFRTFCANGGSVSLNTSGQDVYNGRNSVFIKNAPNTYSDGSGNPTVYGVDFGTKNTDNLWWTSADKVKDGYCFWISVDREVTISWQNCWSTIATITIPYGKHIITIPKTNNSFLYDSKIIVHGGNEAKIYIDAIGTFEDHSMLETNGGIWAQGYNAPASATPGTVLPTYENITKEGLTFGGWYENPDFSGERIYTIPGGASKLQKYYARWIKHNVDGTDFENYTDETFADAHYFWTGVSGTTAALNTNTAYVSGGTKSVKLNLKVKGANDPYNNTDFGNGEAYSWWAADQNFGDGVCFWINTDQPLTIKLHAYNKDESAESVYVGAGKHFVTIPNDIVANRRQYFRFRIANPSKEATVYIDDIGTYFNIDQKEDIAYNLNGGYFVKDTNLALQTSNNANTVLPTECQVKKNGYYFAGWYDNAEFTGTPKFYLKAADYNVQLFAKWVEKVEINYDFENMANAAALATDGWKDSAVYDDPSTSDPWDGSRPKGGGFSTITVETSSSNVGSGSKSLRGEYEVFTGDYVNKYGQSPNAVFRRYIWSTTFGARGVEREGDGFCFWIKSDRAATINISFLKDSDARLERDSDTVDIPANVGVKVYMPWSQFSSEDRQLASLGFKIYGAIGTTGKIWIDDLGIYYNEIPYSFVGVNDSGDIKITSYNSHVPKGAKAQFLQRDSRYLQSIGAKLPTGSDIAYLTEYNLTDAQGETIQLGGNAWINFKAPSGANTSKLGVYNVSEDGSLIPVNYTFIDGWMKASISESSGIMLVTLNDNSWFAKGPAVAENIVQDVSGSKTFDASKNPLKRGVNFGVLNFDYALGYDSYMLQSKYYEMISDKGFDHIRVPVDFFQYMNSNYIIDEELMCKIDTIINLALDANLKVVLDAHHFAGDLQTNVKGNEPRYYSMWEQLSERYKNYPSGLVFELINEPGNKSAIKDGGPDVVTPESIMRIQENAIKIIRKTNPTRLIVHATAWNNGAQMLMETEPLLPSDKNIIMSIHCYAPGKFTHQGADWSEYEGGTPGGVYWDEATMRYGEEGFQATYDLVAQYQETYGRPVWLGEFGTMHNAIPEGQRALYAAASIEALNEAKIGWCWFDWDSNFGIYNASTDKWMTDGVVDALIPRFGITTPTEAGLFVHGDDSQNSDITGTTSGSAVYIENGVEYSAFRVFGEYIAPDNGNGDADPTKVIINADGDVRQLASRHVMLGYKSKPTLENNYVMTTSKGESLNYFWTKVKNNNGTWTIRYSLLLKKIPKEYKDTEFNVRSAIVYLENGVKKTLYTETYEYGISAQKIYNLTSGYSWYTK